MGSVIDPSCLDSRSTEAVQGTVRRIGGVAVCVVLVVAGVLAANGLGRWLLKSSGGTYGPTPYIAVSFPDPAIVQKALPSGVPFTVDVTNTFTTSKLLPWSATEASATIDGGVVVVPAGQTRQVVVRTDRATTGVVTVSFAGTSAEVTIAVGQRTSTH
jgi:hypothetical protein